MEKWLKKLVKTGEQGLMVRIDRRPDIKDRIEGFVVGASPEIVLIHVVDPSVRFNGYTAIRTIDITAFRVLDDTNSFAGRALQLRGEAPVSRPDVSLVDMGTLLATAGLINELVAIQEEKRDPGNCHIGNVERLTEKAVSLVKLDPAARWRETQCFKLKNITRVDFGGGYEEALALVAAAEAPATE